MHNPTPLLTQFSHWTVKGKHPSQDYGWKSSIVWAGQAYIFMDLSGCSTMASDRDCVAVFDASVSEIQIKRIVV